MVLMKSNQLKKQGISKNNIFCNSYVYGWDEEQTNNGASFMHGRKRDDTKQREDKNTKKWWK